MNQTALLPVKPNLQEHVNYIGTKICTYNYKSFVFVIRYPIVLLVCNNLQWHSNRM